MKRSEGIVKLRGDFLLQKKKKKGFGSKPGRNPLNAFCTHSNTHQTLRRSDVGAIQTLMCVIIRAAVINRAINKLSSIELIFKSV